MRKASGRIAAGMTALAAGMALVAAGAARAAVSPEEQAARILETAGVQGGLVAHLGCGDGKLTAALRASDGFLVHGLSRDAATVEKARAAIRRKGLYGPVSVDRFDGKHLPYANNLVNLVVADDLGNVPRAEVMRVLAPGGIACVKADGGWKKTVKPRPDAIDEWTHYLHGPDNNAVAQDSVVGPPKHVQWIGGPPHSRSHEFNSSMGAMVTSGGRLFYIWDEGPIGVVDKRLPSDWKLIARDAFNGKILWKRAVPDWGWRQWNIKSRWDDPKKRGRLLRDTPATLPRRLVAKGGRVYVTLAYNAPVSVLDAARGEKICDFEQTEMTDEIILSGNTLVLNKRDEQDPPETDVWNNFGVITPKQSGRVMAVDTETGKVRWKAEKDMLAPLSMAVRKGRVYYSNYKQVVCLDMQNGRELWRSRTMETGIGHRATCGTLVPTDKVVLYSYPSPTGWKHHNDGKLVALSAKTGKLLWEGPTRMGAGLENTPDLFVVDGLVWLGSNRKGRGRSTKVRRRGFDPSTGKVCREISVPSLRSSGHHYRCYRSKATERYLLLPKRGAEYLDLKGNNHVRCNWVRAPCVYGALPANGLTYFAPHPCVCYPGVLINHFNALAPARPEEQKNTAAAGNDNRLRRGPAWENVQSGKETSGSGAPGDWPMYRRNPRRSGSIKTTVPVRLKQNWAVTVGGKITPPVVADGRLVVAETDAHTVYAFDADTGSRLWHFTAGGRIDSPPGIHERLVLFGCADGRVYCLRATDGKLVWRFTAAPLDRRVLVYGRLESPWPVHGSVLVQEDAALDPPRPVVYFTAGRSSFLDGGMRMFGLDPATGEILHKTRLEGPYPDPFGKPSREAHNMDGLKSDLLTGGDNRLYLYHKGFKGDLSPGGAARRLMTVGGFLDDTYNEGYYWSYRKGWPGCHRKLIGKSNYGHLLVFNDKAVFGVHVMTMSVRVRRGFIPGTGERLFAREHGASRDRWSRKIDLRIQGMVLAGETLFVAGPPDVVPKDDPLAAYEGRAGCILQAVSASTGGKLSELSLEAPPVFDGLIAAGGRLYLVDRAGGVRCLGGD